MTDSATEAAVGAGVAKAEPRGIRFYLGPYATGSFWRGLVKNLIEVGVRELILAMAKAFAGAFVGTVSWYMKKTDPVAEVTATTVGDNTASKVFSSDYTPQRDYSPSRPVSTYSPPAGFGSNEPFTGWGR